ncbi:MAG: hypothetical protein CBC38_05295 [Gammaproteobacteria bacterium TMED78]|nr:MAG: hypothetical protein CBC38_05295 [Gammaproteobacteria bacterium TMED78]|tara:strand:- start:37442 stop:37828 length:387 start_codon:yes stop_codon:yes gene_type:complete
MTYIFKTLTISFFLLPVFTSAHHSKALHFTEQLITLEGKIKSTKWINPHASFVLEVTNEAGEKEDWLVELLATIALRRGSFDFDAMTEQTEIKLTGFLGRQENTIDMTEAILPDGRVIVELPNNPYRR